VTDDIAELHAAAGRRNWEILEDLQGALVADVAARAEPSPMLRPMIQRIEVRAADSPDRPRS
jgi:hypothetical protein